MDPVNPAKSQDMAAAEEDIVMPPEQESCLKEKEEANGHYEPMQTTGIRDNSRPLSKARSATSGSIGYVRSNNGHGCADLDNSADEANGTVEKDPFEVAWDSDNDPLCPRSMSLIHKWTIVLIVGMGSLCV